MKNGKQIEKTLQIGEKIYTYTLTRKAVKYVNLRVRPDGSIAVSSPAVVPLAEIERFIASKSDYIDKARARLAKPCEAMQMPTFRNGSSARIHGIDFPVCITKGKQISCACREKTLFFTVEDPENEIECLKAVQSWACERIKELILYFCRDAESKMKPYGVPSPEIKFRKMKSRWGSCNTRKTILTFNYALIHVPVSVVEYVVYHEYAHFVHPNHSPAFHEFVARFVPDSQLKREILKGIPCVFLFDSFEKKQSR